jgi:integrase/recombinase XerD
MINIYRRHRKHCPHRSDGRRYRRCHCPIWADGKLGTEDIRKATGLRDWQKAQDLIRKWEAEGQRSEEDKPEPMTIEEACRKFEVDAHARKLNESTVYKYRLLFRQLKGFAEQRGLRFLVELDVDALSAFRAQWHDGPRSSLKKLERLRAFLGFAQRRRWVDGNPASELKAPRVSVRPTLPFTREEMMKILEAADGYISAAAPNARQNARRLRTLVLLLRYSGMRIGDAIGLSQDRVAESRLFLYTAKTGVPVYTVLPQFVVSALASTPMTSGKYFFWSGVGKLQTAVKVWEGRLRRLFNLAGMPDGHAHRFRDTLAVELLLARVPMERVAVLLGHQSVRTTERHYAPWVRARQEQLEADLERAWREDPVVLLEMKGTQQVRSGERVQ